MLKFGNTITKITNGGCESFTLDRNGNKYAAHLLNHLNNDVKFLLFGCSGIVKKQIVIFSETNSKDIDKKMAEIKSWVIPNLTVYREIGDDFSFNDLRTSLPKYLRLAGGIHDPLDSKIADMLIQISEG